MDNKWNDKLYNAWVKNRKKKCKEDETDNRGSTCLCNICNDKRKHYTAYKEYCKTLKRIRIKMQDPNYIQENLMKNLGT